MSQASSKLTFFRQSGWMMIATVVGGGLMWAVHMPAGKMDPVGLGEKPEYGVFATMLQVLTMMTIPSIGLQTVVMRQTVAALSDSLRRQLSQAVRTLLGGTLIIWLLAMVGVFLFQGRLMTAFKISNPATVWLTASWGLWVLWLPVLVGLLQGSQNFFGMGWVSMLGGLVRLLAMVVIVLWLHWQAAGACLAVLLQMLAVVIMAGWLTRGIWLGRGEPVAWGDWGKRVLPLTIGPGVVTYMMSLDMIVVQYYFPEGETGFYGAAGMIGRALVFLTAPLTQVMFPKVVQSAAKAEKSDAMLLALGATALIGAGAALFCTALPRLPLWIIYDESYLKIAWLVPWFAWCMLPLTLGAVLVNALVARERYGVVAWLVVLGLAYVGTLALVCQQNSSPLLRAGSFKDVPALAAKLRGGADTVSKYVWRQISPEAKRSLTGQGARAETTQILTAELNRIAKNEPLYGSSLLANNDFRDVPSLAAKLTQPPDAASQFLRQQIDKRIPVLPPTFLRSILLRILPSLFAQEEIPPMAKPTTSSGGLNPVLIQKLNSLLQSNAVYGMQSIAGIKLSEETRLLLAQNPQGEGLVRLNRLLLEDAFPREIARSVPYDVGRFESVPLSKTTQNLLAKRPTGDDLIRLNRLLLEEAYPAELVPMVRGFLPVVQTLGGFGLLLVAISLWFTLRAPPHCPTQAVPLATPGE